MYKYHRSTRFGAPGEHNLGLQIKSFTVTTTDQILGWADSPTTSASLKSSVPPPCCLFTRNLNHKHMDPRQNTPTAAPTRDRTTTTACMRPMQCWFAPQAGWISSVFRVRYNIIFFVFFPNNNVYNITKLPCIDIALSTYICIHTSLDTETR